MSGPRRDGGSTARRFALPLALIVFGLPAGIMAVMAIGSPPADKDPFIPIDGSARKQVRTAQPRWEPVTTITGTGPTNTTFKIAADASQWKATWDCDAGRMQVTGGAMGSAAKTLVDSACPRNGVRTQSETGRHALKVDADGPWRIVIEQQVHTALMRAPLQGMTDAAIVARGPVRSIQRRSEGDIVLYRLAGGRLALRFEDFYTTGSPGLEVWLSQAPNPKSTLAARDAPHVNAGRLRSTLGTYNQLLPPEVTVEEIKSVVIWCPTVTIAFGAANMSSA